MRGVNMRTKNGTKTSFYFHFSALKQLLQYVLSPSHANLSSDWLSGSCATVCNADEDNCNILPACSHFNCKIRFEILSYLQMIKSERQKKSSKNQKHDSTFHTGL